MNKKITFAFILVFLALLLVSCKDDEDPTESKTTSDIVCTNHSDLNNDYLCDDCGVQLEKPTETTPVESVIVITAKEETISLKDTIALSYDYKQLFTIVKDGNTVPVLDSYIDATQVSVNPGTYEVSCTYEGKKASIFVQVIETVYEVILSTNEITINKSLVLDYDFLSLFVAKTDGIVINITDEMISNNVKAEVGQYEFTVTNNRVNKTLIVNVTDDHKIEIINNYNNVEIYYNELLEYDFTKLFSLYVDSKAVEVTMDMIDTSSLINAVIGESYEIKITYQTDTNDLSKSITIKVIESKELTVTGKNLVIYPNAEYIDLCSLFEIKYGNEIIPVTSDMVTGSINYTSVGINEITLNYQDKTVVSTVEVKKGVVINHRYGDTRTVMKGTNQDTYSFASDFIVVVNGVEMDAISDSYFILGELDFNTVGTYEVKISIPYNENRVGLSGVKFTYYEETITYVVVQNEYEITILDDLVELEEGSTSYNVYKNLKVRINNRNQTLTEVPEYASVIACYVQTISEPIDFNKPGNQKVEIAVYVNGPENDPVYVTYEVSIATDLLVEAFDKVIYTQETLYTRDLFKITKAGENIEVSNDMINGGVDTFTPGVYLVEINYMGIQATSKVVVLDKFILGTYKTLQTSIPTTSVDASDEEVVTPGKLLGNLVIKEDGTIKIGSKSATIIDAIDEHTFLLKVGGYEYTLYYQDGIVVLNPENKIKLEFNDEKRPFIYFNNNLWQVQELLTINSHANHVLVGSYPCYTIEAFKIQANSDYSQKWYGLKVDMVKKMNSDTVYEVSWGDINFAADFINDINQISYLNFNGNKYQFKVGAKNIAKIYDDTNPKKYANMTFTGTYNSMAATLHVDQHGAFTFLVNGEKLCYASSYDLSQMKNGGPNFVEDTVLLYDFDDAIFAYKFQLDLENKSFTFIEDDSMIGKYQFGNYMFYFDGYGTGIFKDDIKSYYEYPFEYRVKGKEIDIEFIKPEDNFIYGTKAHLYLDDFGNILTIGSIAKDELIGIKLENQNIIDGAIIRVNTTKIGKNTDTIAKQELYKNIEIITKDGVVSGDAIKNFINTSAIRFNTPGFYQFTITVNVNGEDIVGYYGLQILDTIYEGNKILGEYTGIIDNKTTITIDKYGIAKVKFTDVLYQGTVKINEDNSFSIKAYSNTRAAITISGELVKDGIISVRSTGAAIFNEYLTTGATEVIGSDGLVLRLIQVASQQVFTLSNMKTNFGTFVNVEVLSGTNVLTKNAIIRIYDDNQEIIAKVGTWGNTFSGLIKQDGYRGTYSSDGNQELFIDGFGSIQIGEDLGSYDLYDNILTVSVGNDVIVYQLDKNLLVYKILNIELNNTLVEGKTFKGSYTYFCSSYPYIADT